jgi:hypothetical protein
MRVFCDCVSVSVCPGGGALVQGVSAVRVCGRAVEACGAVGRALAMHAADVPTQAAASAARALPKAPCRVVTVRRGYLQFRRDPNHFRFHVYGQHRGRSRPHTGRHVLSPHTHHARPGLPLPWHTQHTRWQCSAPGVGCAVRVLGCLGLAAAGRGLGGRCWPVCGGA